MNLDTVLKCATAMAEKQMAGLGHVSADVQALIDELTPAPVVESEVAVEAPQESAPKSKKAKSSE